MKRVIAKFRESKFREFVLKYQKHAPILFFVGGFIFDSLTLGRVDRLYDLTVLCAHMTSLSTVLYLYNLTDDGRWKDTFLERYQLYFPLVIQFLFGALSSAYVVYFARSVSLSKTISFFVILVALLIANEFLKKRISNKYLQFGVYFFVNFTFFTFMIPVFIKEMSTPVFIISGILSLIVTILLITFIYRSSPSTRSEISFTKLIGLVIFIYCTINTFYFFRLIPPVPLALDTGIVAHSIDVKDNKYLVSYERDAWYIFWRKHRLEHVYTPGSPVYVFSSIFAPTKINKEIVHRWQWYNAQTENWEIVEDIGFKVIGGRDDGYRGYTYKKQVKPGEWNVKVMTREELVLGSISFILIEDEALEPQRVKIEAF